MGIFLHAAINMPVNPSDKPYIPFSIFYTPFFRHELVSLSRILKDLFARHSYPMVRVSVCFDSVSHFHDFLAEIFLSNSDIILRCNSAL